MSSRSGCNRTDARQGLRAIRRTKPESILIQIRCHDIYKLMNSGRDRHGSGSRGEETQLPHQNHRIRIGIDATDLVSAHRLHGHIRARKVFTGCRHAHQVSRVPAAEDSPQNTPKASRMSVSLKAVMGNIRSAGLVYEAQFSGIAAKISGTTDHQGGTRSCLHTPSAPAGIRIPADSCMRCGHCATGTSGYISRARAFR